MVEGFSKMFRIIKKFMAKRNKIKICFKNKYVLVDDDGNMICESRSADSSF